ncbi:dienelactone hydrolase family protein [Dyella sp.]|uniref:alpha/beta hydrolase family protein n=1 Tax=Dyella sp. TaxID=1869338 RepID=UPI002FD927AA
MKWLKRLAALLAVLFVVLGVYVFSTARRSDKPVGFQVVRVESPSGPIAVALWYPTTGVPRATTFIGGNLLSVARDAPVLGTGLPVVVISHGNDGSALSHVDLAMDLASAGYVVAAPTHAGDNYADRSRQDSPALFNERAEQVRATLDYVLQRWPNAHAVDQSRVGAFGFSAGGFTVLTLAGGTPDMTAIANHCRRTPEFICKVLAQVGSPLVTSSTGAGVFKRDARIRAAVVAAPGLGFTFDHGGLSDVRIPVQVWHGANDETVPYATNVQIIEQGLGDHAETHTLPGATHLSFLAPCGLLKPPALCKDPGGFDRVAAHKAMNAEVVRFFATHLRGAGGIK